MTTISVFDTTGMDELFFSTNSEQIRIFTHELPSVLANVIETRFSSITDIEAGVLSQELTGNRTVYTDVVYSINQGSTFDVNNGIDMVVDGIVLTNTKVA